MAPAPLLALLVCVPLYGHLNPMLTMGRAMLRSTDPRVRVQVATVEDMRGAVEAAGLEFVSMGTLAAADQARLKSLFELMLSDSSSGLRRFRLGLPFMTDVYARALGSALLSHLAAANASGALPDVLVTDGVTAAGYDAAEVFRLPLSVAWLHPTSMALSMAGHGTANYPPHVPFECVTSLAWLERSHPLLQRALSPLLKRVYEAWLRWAMLPSRNAARAVLGLPPLAAPALRRHGDGSVAAAGGTDGSVAVYAVQPAVPRAQFLLGITNDLNAERPLPPAWQVVGPFNIDWAQFPPRLSDAHIEAFLADAQAAGEPVVLVTHGSIWQPLPEQLDALVGAITELATPAPGRAAARVLWGLNAALHGKLPAHMRILDAARQPAAGDDAAEPTPLSGGGLAGRVLVASWLDQPAVLSHGGVHAFVSHGGLGSVHEALAAGKPTLVVPWSGGADHAVIASQLHGRGLGELLPLDQLSSTSLAAAARGLLSGGYEAHAADVARRWRAEGLGAQRAARAVLTFAAAGSCS